jgi:hypothetical protein
MSAQYSVHKYSVHNISRVLESFRKFCLRINKFSEKGLKNIIKTNISLFPLYLNALKEKDLKIQLKFSSIQFN